MKHLTKVWHPYWLWEELEYNMYGEVDNKEEALKLVVKFMSNTSKFSKYMKRVTNEFKYSCEHNFTCSGINKQAWLGQSAVALGTGIPEHITREGWFMLTEEERINANKAADKHIENWISNYKQHA